MRKQEPKELAAKGYEPVLKKSRFCFLKRATNLIDKQQIRLKEFLADNLKTVRAYQIKESFDVFWGYVSVYEELLMNYFRAKKQYHSGMVEGFNLTVGHAMRKAYGFRNFEHLSIALYYQLGDLPEPKSTHRFCG